MKLLNQSLMQCVTRIRQCVPSFSLLVLISLLAIINQGCQTIPTTDPNIQRGATKTLVVNSNRFVERYRVAEHAFTQSLDHNTFLSVDLSQEQDPVGLLQDTLNQGQYDTIYCIGAKALGSIDHIAPDQTIVFSSVLNWQRFTHHPDIRGVASDVAPSSQLAMFKHFFPGVKRLGVIYSKTNENLIRQARQAAKDVGVTLDTLLIEDTYHLLEELTAMATRVDALWLVADPVVLSSAEQTKALFQQANSLTLPILSSNRFYKDIGAVFTISADLPTVGRQAAVLIGHNQDNSEQRIHYPVGSYITLNMKRVEQYQLELNYQALDSVNDLIE